MESSLQQYLNDIHDPKVEINPVSMQGLPDLAEWWYVPHQQCVSFLEDQSAK